MVSVGARSLPVWSLELPLNLVWKGQGDAEIQAVEWWGSFSGYPGPDLPPTVVAVGPEWLTRPACGAAAGPPTSHISQRTGPHAREAGLLLKWHTREDE